MITFPGAYHGGFNTGLNCAEAVNFAPADWLRFGGPALERYRSFRKPSLFSYEWLLLKVRLKLPAICAGWYCYLHLAISETTLASWPSTICCLSLCHGPRGIDMSAVIIFILIRRGLYSLFLERHKLLAKDMQRPGIDPCHDPGWARSPWRRRARRRHSSQSASWRACWPGSASGAAASGPRVRFASTSAVVLLVSP